METNKDKLPLSRQLEEHSLNGISNSDLRTVLLCSVIGGAFSTHALLNGFNQSEFYIHSLKFFVGVNILGGISSGTQLLRNYLRSNKI